MAILKIRDKNGVVHEIVALKGEKGDPGSGGGGASHARDVAYDGSEQYTGGSNVEEALNNINAEIANFSFHGHSAPDIGYANSSVEGFGDVGGALDYLFEQMGDVSAAFDELHAYAQALVNGGVAE